MKGIIVLALILCGSLVSVFFYINKTEVAEIERKVGVYNDYLSWNKPDRTMEESIEYCDLLNSGDYVSEPYSKYPWFAAVHNEIITGWPMPESVKKPRLLPVKLRFQTGE